MSNWGTIAVRSPPQKKESVPPTKYTIKVSFNSRVSGAPWSVDFMEKCHPCRMVEFHCQTKTVLRPRTGRPPRGYIVAYGTAEIIDGVCYVRS